MLSTHTVADIRALRPCYDPVERGYATEDWQGTALFDGHNFERCGRNVFLYCTPCCNYFTVNLTQWQGERDTLTPCDVDTAIELYEGLLSEHEMEYSDAFPGIEILEA